MRKPEMLDDLFDLLKRAGQAILSYDADRESWQATHKADSSPLTPADLQSQEILAKGLQSLTPEWPLISEEGEWIPYEVRKNWQEYWLLDPLDGTREFLSGTGDFAINLSHMVMGRPRFAMIYLPVKRLLFYAAAGEGAFCIENGNTRRLRCTSFRISQKGLRVICSRYGYRDKEKWFVSQLQAADLAFVGSSIKLSWLAEGKAELYPRFGRTMEWDTAPGQLLLEEAGGHLIDPATGQALKYNKPDLANPHFLACGDTSLNGLLELLQPLQHRD